MEHDRKTFFAEEEQDDVKGFTVIETSEDMGYHIAEKWIRGEGDGVWVQYWIPEEQLLSRVEAGACTPKGKLTDSQFEKVRELVGMDFDKEAVEA